MSRAIELQYLTAEKFLAAVGASYNVEFHGPYRQTHSKEYILPYGKFIPKRFWRLPSLQAALRLGPVFHPLPPFPSSVNGVPLRTESDVSHYSYYQVIVPSLTLLHHIYPGFDFYAYHEEFFGDPADPADPSIVADEYGTGRLDLIIKAREKGGDGSENTIVIVEYKRAGVLREKDWDLPTLTDNARIISCQSRHYMFAAQHNLVIVFDGTGMVVQFVDLDDLAVLPTRRTIHLQVLWEGRKEMFVKTMVSGGIIGMMQRRVGFV